MTLNALLRFSPESVSPSIRERIERLVNPSWFEGELDSLESNQLEDIDVLITGARPLSGRELQLMTHLRLVLATGTGFEWIDTAHCQERRIIVCNTPGYTGAAVAEHAFGLFMTLAKHIVDLDRAVRDGRDTAGQLSLELKGKSAGIVGYGDVGSRIGTFARAFGMNVVYSTRTSHHHDDARRVALDELFAESHAVFLTLPETNETSGMIDARRLATMRHDSILVNVSADGLVERDALIDALSTGRIGGAALDIIEPDPVYFDVPRLILTPAHGWYTPECIERRAAIWTDTLEAFVNGSPSNVAIGADTQA